MERVTKILIGILAIIVLLFSLFYTFEEKKTFPVEFYLSEKPGMDFSQDYLGFGRITPNQSSLRIVQVANSYDEQVKIKIKASKSISKQIIVSENNFYLKPYEVRNITFTAFTDGLEEFKKYEGEVTIITQRKLF